MDTRLGLPGDHPGMWMATVGALTVATTLDAAAAVSWDVDATWGLGLGDRHGPGVNAVALESAELAAWWLSSPLAVQRTVPDSLPAWQILVAGVMVGAAPPAPAADDSPSWQSLISTPGASEHHWAYPCARNTLDMGAGQATLLASARRIAEKLTTEAVAEALTTEQSASVVARSGLRWTGVDALDWLALLGLGGAPWVLRPARDVYWPIVAGQWTAQDLDSVVDGSRPAGRWHRATVERSYHPDGYQTHALGKYGHFAGRAVMPPEWTPWRGKPAPWRGRWYDIGLVAELAEAGAP